MVAKRIESFNRELDSILGGCSSTVTDLMPEDLCALKLAGRLAEVDFSSQNKNRMILRKRLVDRYNKHYPSSVGRRAHDGQHLALCASIVVVLLILFSGVLRNWVELPLIDLHPIASSSSPAVILASTAPLAAMATPKAESISPRPIPTPIAPKLTNLVMQNPPNLSTTPPQTPDNRAHVHPSVATP